MVASNYNVAIKQTLLDAIGNGMTGLAIISKDGFTIESVGDLSSREIGLSSVFSIAIPKMVEIINSKYVSNLNKLLDEKAKLEEIHMGGFSFKLGERQFISLNMGDFTFIASIDNSIDISVGFRKLIQVVPKVFDILSEISGKKVSPLILATPEIKHVEPVETRSSTATMSDKKTEGLRIFLLKIRELVFDIKKGLIEQGDWNTALQGFKRFEEYLEELKNLAPEISDHPAIRAINNWVEKTISTIEQTLETEGNEKIDEQKKNILRRSLSKAVEYIRFVISKELGNR